MPPWDEIWYNQLEINDLNASQAKETRKPIPQKPKAIPQKPDKIPQYLSRYMAIERLARQAYSHLNKTEITALIQEEFVKGNKSYEEWISRMEDMYGNAK
jgi:hypothetical protein